MTQIRDIYPTESMTWQNRGARVLMKKEINLLGNTGYVYVNTSMLCSPTISNAIFVQTATMHRSKCMLVGDMVIARILLLS